MIDVANEWLQNHGQQWEVINCETIIMPFKYNDTNNCFELKPNDCYFYIYGSGKNNILRALRYLNLTVQKFELINYLNFNSFLLN